MIESTTPEVVNPVARTIEQVLPDTIRYILDELKHIPEEVRKAIPDPLDEQERIELSILKTLQVIDHNTEMVYTESVAVPVLEHKGPDIQYEHVPCTDAIKDLPKLYWDMVSS